MLRRVLRWLVGESAGNGPQTEASTYVPPVHIRSPDLTKSDVPKLGPTPTNASEELFLRFALSFDGESAFPHCAQLANDAADTYRTAGGLPGTIGEIRACLYFEQRRMHHSGGSPYPSEWEYFGALLDALRELVPPFPEREDALGEV